MAATVAHTKVSGKANVMKAMRARSRSTREVGHGDWVWVLRRNQFESWKEGPCVCVMRSGTSCWVMVNGNLAKCNVEIIQLATSEEIRGVEAVPGR